ncbi:hypothetical protein J2W18_002301 [Rhodococcus cercidiphylli]|nr:hypothetical protein [Rhodococcus cercidiphylli]
MTCVGFGVGLPNESPAVCLASGKSDYGAADCESWGSGSEVDVGPTDSEYFPMRTPVASMMSTKSRRPVARGRPTLRAASQVRTRSRRALSSSSAILARPLPLNQERRPRTGNGGIPERARSGGRCRIQRDWHNKYVGTTYANDQMADPARRAAEAFQVGIQDTFGRSHNTGEFDKSTQLQEFVIGAMALL